MEDPIVVNSYNNIINVQDDSLLINAINSAKGRQSLARSMAQPLRTRIDYQSIGRKTFIVQQLPTGALPIYDKDIDVCSALQDSKQSLYPDDEIVVNPNNDIIDKQSSYIHGQRVVIPQFQIFNSPTIKISEIKRRRFNLIDRTRDDIMAQEDSSIFDALDKIDITKE